MLSSKHDITQRALKINRVRYNTLKKFKLNVLIAESRRIADLNAFVTRWGRVRRESGLGQPS